MLAPMQLGAGGPPKTPLGLAPIGSLTLPRIERGLAYASITMISMMRPRHVQMYGVCKTTVFR
jgi:hypothetical protein